MATYDEIYNLWASRAGWLRNRVVTAIGHYATYLAGLGNGATADQKAFVARVMPGSNAEIEADYILWALVNDTDVQESGAAITDIVLQAKVENWLTVLGRIQAL
jgi:hypothetical protein